MPRYVDIGGWVLAAFALGLGVLAAWVADLHMVTENTATAAGYTAITFACLVMALRPAWNRLRFWIDLAALLVLHLIIVLLLVNYLDSHLIRLNWVMGLPLVVVELLVFLGLLWRRNVKDFPS
jgi:hypothetical protein